IRAILALRPEDESSAYWLRETDSRPLGPPQYNQPCRFSPRQEQGVPMAKKRSTPAEDRLAALEAKLARIESLLETLPRPHHEYRISRWPEGMVTVTFFGPQPLDASFVKHVD